MTYGKYFYKRRESASGFFTGTAYVNMLIPDTEKQYDCQVNDEIFEAGVRNNWHKHPRGQLLLVTAGCGYYQERGKAAQVLHYGDVVKILPDVEHWHGAAPDSSFTHIGISPNIQKGGAEWLGPPLVPMLSFHIRSRARSELIREVIGL
jgi:quercetin dioxygenase-like cupin family protein